MTGAQLKKAREKLKLTQQQMGTLLGYGGKPELLRNLIGDLEADRRRVREPQRRLVEAGR